MGQEFEEKSSRYCPEDDKVFARVANTSKLNYSPSGEDDPVNFSMVTLVSELISERLIIFHAVRNMILKSKNTL